MLPERPMIGYKRSVNVGLDIKRRSNEDC